MTEPEQRRIQFPCPWEMRVIAMGDQAEAVRRALVSLLERDGQAPAVTDGAASSQGRYVAFRVTFTAHDRGYLEEFSRSVSSVPGVKMLL